jgi:endonuclease YncB( thermonuclease family)
MNRFDIWNKKNTPRFTLQKRTLLCKCIDVYDGDTCTLAVFINDSDPVPYAFHTRMLGYDSPELKSKDQVEKDEGKKCREVLKSLIFDKMVVVVFGDEHGKKEDKFGRQLATIFVRSKEGNGATLCGYLLPETSPALPADVGTTSEMFNVNRFMIDNVCCYPYQGEKKRDFSEYYQEFVRRSTAKESKST